MSYSSEVLADSPWLYLETDETSGTTLADSSGNSRPMTITGSAHTLAQTGPDGSTADAIHWAGGTTGRAATSATRQFNATDFSFECWVYLTATPSQNAPILANTDGSSTSCVMWVDTARKLNIRVFDTQSRQATAATALALNTWHHIVMVSDVSGAVSMKARVNKVDVASVAINNSTSSPNALPIMLRGSGTFLSNPTGAIRTARPAVYTTALSNARIDAHYDALSSGGISLGTATRTAVALALTAIVGTTATLGTATRTATPNALTLDTGFPALGTATRSSTANALGLAVTLGTLDRTAVANALTVTLGYTETDTSNRVGGRQRSGYGIATWTPTVAPPPAGIVLGESQVVAFSRGAVTMDGTQPTFTETTAVEAGHRHRVLVGGVDVTWFRDTQTPMPTYQLAEPLLYGVGSLTFPQITTWAEPVGVGELSWLKKHAPVLVQRVDSAGNVVATDYKGIIIAFDARGDDLVCELGGEASGRAALREQQIPLFTFKRNIGRLAYRAIQRLNLPFAPRGGPDTGITVATFGGTGYLDYISQICAKAWTRAGNQWAIMPDANGVYRMARKDTTTIHGTVYLDGARTVGDLRRDTAEEPNRVYATGVTPEGQRVRFGVYPGLKQGDAAPYPFNDDRNFSAGTTDGETDTGDGITVMLRRLAVMGYLDVLDEPGGYDADVTKAIREAQDDFDLTVTGNMNPATWRRLYDLDATGFTLQGSHIEPAAQKSKTRPWIRSGSAGIVARNPNFDRSVLPVDRNVDMGTGHTRSQMREWARAEVDRGEDNWVGSITFHTGALVAGDHTPGDPIVSLLRARDLRPGMNLSLPQSPGGAIVVHVSGVNVSEDGTVTATVDTRARDAMEVWEVIERNRESRRDPARQWRRAYRSSGMVKDGVTEWDEVGGLLGNNITLDAHRWRVFEVVAGQAGTVASLITRTNPDAEYVMAVFAREPSPRRLAHMIGNPLTNAGSARWEDETVRDRLTNRFLFLYAAGNDDEPLGYYPKRKAGDNPLTGRWEDAAGFGYYTDKARVLYVAVYADRDTVIPAGRIMRHQMESGA